jgi:8-oxoguanine deaminase
VINGKVIVEDGEIVTMDMRPVIETHNRCASQMANG